MITDITIYETQTGRILQSGNCGSDSVDAQVYDKEKYSLIELASNPYEDYISNDTYVIKRINQDTTLSKLTLIADGIDIITVSNCPNGLFTARNKITNEIIVGNISSTDTFSTTILGTYQIKIESFPYLDFEATIEAT